MSGVSYHTHNISDANSNDNLSVEIILFGDLGNSGGQVRIRESGQMGTPPPPHQGPALNEPGLCHRFAFL